jgi:hypothetical protein
MEFKKFEMYSKINFNGALKGCKYSLMLDDETTLKFNHGRALEFSLQKANGYKELKLENVNHRIAGDININGKEYNIKSYKCELKSEGKDKTEKIKNYIKEDASAGLIYIVEIEKQLVAIKMNWTEAEKFLQIFGVIESSNNLRVRTCDKKIYQWAMLQK